VTKAAPWLRRHIEQWQWTQKRVGSSTSNRTAPQRQEPGTDDGSGVSLEDFTLLCSFLVRHLPSHFRKASATQTSFPANRFIASWSGVFGRSISASTSGHETELGRRARGGHLCLTFTGYHDRAGEHTRAKPL
jgi:hypothetical protein